MQVVIGENIGRKILGLILFKNRAILGYFAKQYRRNTGKCTKAEFINILILDYKCTLNKNPNPNNNPPRSHPQAFTLFTVRIKTVLSNNIGICRAIVFQLKYRDIQKLQGYYKI